MLENSRIRYAIVIERAGNAYFAYVPDLPGCIATASTIADVQREITIAIRAQIDRLRIDDDLVPEPTSMGEPRLVAGADDPFATFTEWAGEADEAAYADL